MIPPQTLESIRAKLDLVELVSEYVPGLSRAGRNMKGRCPFHQERTPSFIVSPERQTFHCFGCGAGGDAFAFLMKIENLGFMEAAEKLAARTGVAIEADRELGPEQKEKLKVKELLEFAAEFYHGLLLKSAEAEAAREYLAGRHVSAQSVETFRLGFAPRSGALLEAAVKKGYARELLVKAGLAAPQRTTGRLRDYFYDRVLFPIWDAKGAVVGFGARTLGEGEPKYLNSPDSPVFSKGRVLYGLFQGLVAVRKSRKVLLMEGYMDVIAAHQHGFPIACAPLGTALTPDHAALVKRYATDAVLVFDSDNAGLNAAIRGAEIALAAGLGVRIATVPEGKDPDELLHKSGVEPFEACLGKAQDLAAFKTELLISREKSPLSPEAKSSVAKSVLAAIEQCPDEILKAEWTRRLAERLGVPVESLKKQMEKTSTFRNSVSHRPAAPSDVKKGAEISEQDRHILVLLLKKPELAALIHEGELSSESARRIWRFLANLKTLPADWSARLLEALPEAERTAASGLLVLVSELGSEDPEAVLKGILNRRRGLARLRELEPQVLAMGAGRPVDADLKEEYRRLLSELKGSRRG